MITLTDVFTFDKPVIVVKRGNHTYYLTDTPQSAIKADYPVPAIRYEVAYQLDDGDYWCGIYDVHREAIDADDCFTMLWNIRDDPRRPLFWSPVF